MIMKIKKPTGIVLLGGLLISHCANASNSEVANILEPENVSLMILGLGIIGVIVFRNK
jgi:hypothetical protein